MTANRPTVSEAVTTCLVFCKDSPDPAAIVRRFVERLGGNPEWDPHEVEQVREQIQDRLTSPVWRHSSARSA